MGQHGGFIIYKNKKVFITGHTGFKGSWMVKVLLNAGALVTGYSLGIPTSPGLFGLLKLDNEMESFMQISVIMESYNKHLIL